jgi:hypothetical protein
MILFCAVPAHQDIFQEQELDSGSQGLFWSIDDRLALASAWVANLPPESPTTGSGAHNHEHCTGEPERAVIRCESRDSAGCCG